MKWSLVLFLIAATRSAKGQNEVYQVIYPSEDLHGSKGDAVIFLNEPGATDDDRDDKNRNTIAPRRFKK